MARVRLGRVTDYPDGRGACVRAGNHRLAVFRDGDRVFVLDDRCPHRGFPLHDGMLAGGSVRCRTHGSCFDLESGAVERGPAAAGVRVHPVALIDGDVEVELP